MLTYVHEHCNEKLSASDIAAVAGISVRECSRCFDRCIGVSPIQYQEILWVPPRFRRSPSTLSTSC